MINRIILSLSILGSSLFLPATELNVEPGNLSALMQDNLDETNLVLNGSIDVRDFKFINESLSKLQTLDMSRVNIVAYSSDMSYFGDKTMYDADEIPQLSFFDMSVTSVTLPSSIKSIGDGAFSGCRNVEQFTIPASVSKIGDFCFYDCDGITSITIPSGVKSIGKYMLSGCDNLQNVSIESNVADFDVADFAFSNCTKLASVTLPDATAHIGESAFMGCDALSSFSFPQSLTSIGTSAFKGTPLSMINLSECKNLSAIGDWAFADNDKLTSLKLSNNISSIGVGTFFMNSKMTSVILPEKVTEVSDFLFTGVDQIEDATGMMSDNVTKIGKYAFADWTNVLRYEIPKNVENIDDNAFQNNTALTDIRIFTKSVPALGNDVFTGVAQKNVKLDVEPGMINAFSTADQWKEFNITSSTGADKNKVSKLKAYFNGTILTIEAPEEISEIILYNVEGLELTRVSADSNAVNIETVDFQGGIYVVGGRLNSGDLFSLKMFRK